METAVNLSDGLLIVEYENETLPKNSEKESQLLFHQNFHALKAVLQLKRLSQDYFPLTPHMELARNAKVLVTILM